MAARAAGMPGAGVVGFIHLPLRRQWLRHRRHLPEDRHFHRILPHRLRRLPRRLLRDLFFFNFVGDGIQRHRMRLRKLPVRTRTPDRRSGFRPLPLRLRPHEFQRNIQDNGARLHPPIGFSVSEAWNLGPRYPAYYIPGVGVQLPALFSLAISPNLTPSMKE